MGPDEYPAEFEISRITADGGGVQNVYACDTHLAESIRAWWALDGAKVVAVKPAPPGFGCKGHPENWPEPTAQH